MKYLIFLTLFLQFHCLKKNPDQYSFWKEYDALQRNIKLTLQDEIFASAHMGALSEENEKSLRKDKNGNPYFSLGGKFQSNWKMTLYPEETIGLSYYSKVTFTPKFWGEKEIYSVEREIFHDISGFRPSDFFKWLNQFSSILANHEAYQNLKTKSANLQFLCNTLECKITETATEHLLEFTLNEKTKSKFPGFYNRTGSRLEKTRFNIVIWEPTNNKEKLRISNNGKTLQFHFPLKPSSSFFSNPKTIRFVGDLQIKSYGITFNLEGLEYVLNVSLSPNVEKLDGRFLGFQKKDISGNFFYFIPTGVIDFFIPGNIDEYISDGLILLTQGTQGRGGNQIHAKFESQRSKQKTHVTFYTESKRKRFSLFGNDESQKATNDFEFFAAWEESMLKDLL